MTDPFLIEGPTLWSCSGGRTSAYMVWRALQAHGGKLPDDHKIIFANTGRERRETLAFVEEIGRRWAVEIVWVEWRPTVIQAERIALLAADGRCKPQVADWAAANADDAGFAFVGPNSASLDGEPFSALNVLKETLPNGRQRFCTQILKVEAIHRAARALGLGDPGAYREPIGIRADEADRIGDGLEASSKDGRARVYPLAKAGVTKRDVWSFWWGEGRRFETSVRPQGFDLDLPDLWGNCDLCFAMGAARREERIRQDPSVAEWWIGEETASGKRFATRETVTTLVLRARAYKATPDLLADLEDDTGSECGTWCPSGEAA